MGMPEAELATNSNTVREPSRLGRLETYLNAYAEEASIGITADFCDPLRPMAYTAVLIPVAAHQESASIVPAMAEYANQGTADPFTIFILLNYPTDRPDADTRKSIAQVEAAKRQFPTLDIRYCVRGYDQPVIGQLRKDLWDATLRLAVSDGLYGQSGTDVIGINHDIDTVRISRHYLHNVQDHYENLQAVLDASGTPETPLPSRFTQVKHFFPFSTHPNIARALLWTDLTYRQVHSKWFVRRGNSGAVFVLCKKAGVR